MLARFALTPRFPMFRDFDEMVRGFDGAFRNEGSEQALLPAVDVRETEKAVELKLDMPGVAPEQIDVKLEGNQLTISAERVQEKTTEHDGWLRRERSQGKFSRSFTIPTTLDGTNPEASYRHGVLTVTLPKREEAQPRSFKVKVDA